MVDQPHSTPRLNAHALLCSIGARMAVHVSGNRLYSIVLLKKIDGLRDCTMAAEFERVMRLHALGERVQ
ncbi:hypothetical protein Y032_0190g1233 [Ancylostoma ceylanicum]|uniref:Uncharacterized protein n=1 Tax=Ancylostoma ceylanicum TaxID=53326 RepID=A0A016SQS6_9BILA|nr:hypothetical protein Y032_0190g1233 [Ancylostoma ceylanicum]